MIKNLLGSRYSFIPHSRVQSNIVWSRLSCLCHGYHKGKTPVPLSSPKLNPVGRGWYLDGWPSPIRYGDTEISSFLNRSPLKKDFLCNMFEFINLLWSLIFIKSIRCILEVHQNESWRTRREIGKSSTCEYNLWVNYSHFAASINFFLPLGYS